MPCSRGFDGGPSVVSPNCRRNEDWTLDRMLKVSEDAVRFAVGEGLPVMYVTEDTTRARPDTLKALYTLAIDCGAARICLADTVGHATPDGVRQLVRFIRRDVIAPRRVVPARARGTRHLGQ